MDRLEIYREKVPKNARNDRLCDRLATSINKSQDIKNKVKPHRLSS